MAFFDLNKKIWQWITLLFLAIIWGSSFILMKKGLEVYSHSVVAALRISIAFLVLIPFAITSLKKVRLKDWKYIIFTGIVGNGIPAFLFTLAQTKVASSLSGMLNSLVPVFALIIGVILFKSKPLKSQIIGIIIGLLGAIGLITSNGLNFENSNINYSLLIVLATLCYALSVNVIKTYLKEINSIHIAALSFFSLGPFTIAYLFTTDFVNVSISNPFSNIALIYIVILSVFGTALAIILFNMLIKKTSTLFATSVTYLIPIVAIFWGFFDGEKINILQLISVIIILTGIYFINKFK
ncbi:MAG: EamA family transporter [Flavobacteriales bacterium]|nr:MAG: EamA family transporter [Flavobacteriales bacterium]